MQNSFLRATLPLHATPSLQKESYRQTFGTVFTLPVWRANRSRHFQLSSQRSSRDQGCHVGQFSPIESPRTSLLKRYCRLETPVNQCVGK
uniref:Uncharacterized protein n=1 Tax=Anguilla anguilla TaxID=7936 RepID=A0A0E9XYA3_ANGAN